MDFFYEAIGGIIISNGSEAEVVGNGAFIYCATGGITIEGCAPVERAECLVYRFPVGCVVYRCDKACSQGKLEAICIKSVRIIQNQPSPWGCFPPPERKVVLYTDTFNTIWEEEELCTKEEAIDCAMAYWEAIQEDASKLKC